MDVREKLVDIVCDAAQINGCIHSCNHPPCAMVRVIVDALIENGVTVHEWIPVKDRFPEAGGYVVCIAKRNPFSRFMPMAARIERNGWVNPITEQYISEVTHWMPLPEPPKGARMDGDYDAKES